MEDLLARFWEATDRFWRTSEALRWTIYGIQSERQAEKSIEALESRRREEIAQTNEAELEAKFLLARMRLLGWPITEAAQALLTASHFTSIDHTMQLKEARTAALGSFEKHATKALSG